ncbi:Inositol-1-monophosphatase [Candidatus Cyrtobacter comes]|uniref:Inositol-1-monophosphatase n=1 Tax=Candidatus Cyrtobacter comes TaxID=675776 RepID=A0ABU5L7X1_9RICK|nr:inositol monophosphatase [Candidatus Cyrtobacter comes]MDZ5761919.1 Inositol-1-monophosphatase [Candidatus Cyrtobacter comes]
MRDNFQISPVMNLMVQASRLASRAIRRDFFELENLRSVEDKVKAFVLKAEKKAATSIIQILEEYGTGYGFVIEDMELLEGKEDKEGTLYNWIIDPIDGTLNFMHSNPNFSISIALERTRGGVKEYIAGLVYSPIHESLAWAEKGKGTHMLQEDGKNKKVLISKEKSWPNSTMAIGNKMLYNDEILMHLREKGVKARISGSSALDLVNVACGRVDVAICDVSRSWDTAAGTILVREARGCVERYSGDLFIFGHDSYCSKFLRRKQLTVGNDS